LRWAFGLTQILPLIGMFALFGLIGNIAGTLWVLYGQDKYQWNGMMVGLSLAAFGAWHAGSQAFLTGRRRSVPSPPRLMLSGARARRTQRRSAVRARVRKRY
jgi:hypothetical protein